MAYDRLKVRIFELKKTQKKVAEELGLSETSFGQKINGKRPFTIPEAEKLIELLNIENPASIFFNR
jgi:transcriptional regulator with XRE-family HTH domain